MARRKLSAQGRIVAAALSVGVAGALAGFMAAGDHTATASSPAASPNSTIAPSSRYADPYRGTTGDVPQYSPQPQTRTGGS
jgi:hypothetical protein